MRYEVSGIEPDEPSARADYWKAIAIEVVELLNQTPGRRRQVPPHWRERVITDDVGCLVWQGHISKRGYARWSINRPGAPEAYRVVYIEERGPIPDGMMLDHLCRNRACVNPDHLEPVTNKENILRGTSPSAMNARKTHCIRGHEFTPENTRIRKTDGARVCRACVVSTTRRRRQAEAV